MSIRSVRTRSCPAAPPSPTDCYRSRSRRFFIRSVIGLKGLRNTLNYGADRIRYLAPVPAGSRLRGRVTVAEAEDVPPDGLRVNYHLVIEIEGGKRPACVAELIALHYR
jgi:acyl dehydratase